LLDPITLKNYGETLPDSTLMSDMRYRMAVLNSRTNIEQFYYCKTRNFFNDKENDWHHMADGGLVDNQGLQVILDQFGTNGVINKAFNNRVLKRLIILNVNAWVESRDKSCTKERPPHVPSVINYTMTTSMDRLSGIRWQNIKAKAKELWTASEALGAGMEQPYCIEVGFRNVESDTLRTQCLALPTSFHLTPKQISLIREVVPDLVSGDNDMKRLEEVLQ